MNAIDEALTLLRRLGAPWRLLKHGELVGETSAELLKTLEVAQVPVDARRVVVGATLHDAGKILCPAELTGRGNEHERLGEPFLLDQGVPADIACFCRTHGQPPDQISDLEGLIVSLADHIWKGTRQQDLEIAVIQAGARRAGRDPWDLYQALDACFERVAADGEERLNRQREP